MLIVTAPFDGYAIGAQITDSAEIAAIKGSGRAHFTVSVADPAPPPVADPVTAKPKPPTD